MKQLIRFSRLATQLLVGGAFLAIFLAGPSRQAQAGSPSTDLQAPDPSSGIQLALDENPTRDIEQTRQQKMELQKIKKPDEKLDEMGCGGPGTCNSMNLNSPLPDPTGCTSGSKCSIEGKLCNPGKHCRTVGAPGQCFCGCVTP